VPKRLDFTDYPRRLASEKSGNHAPPRWLRTATATMATLVSGDRNFLVIEGRWGRIVANGVPAILAVVAIAALVLVTR
jgi:hypothetical protein